jgi:hypothetical protein
MRRYALQIVATLIAMNLVFMLFGDIKHAFFEPTHAEATDRTNFTPAVDAALAEQDDFTTYLYYAFIGWKPGRHEGRYINIGADGTRRTIGNPERYDEKVLVFGGSTAWGYGLPDEHTLPSAMQKLLPGKLVVNKSEISYNATQGLNSLLLALTEQQVERGWVVFYDGVNEIYHSCAPGSEPYGHGREQEIRKVMGERWKYGLVNVLDTLLLKYTRRGADMVKAKLKGRGPESACADEARAWQVARRLATSWQAAHDIAVARGLKFRAILQPSPYSDPSLKLHYTSDEFRTGIEAVYPKVAQLMAGKDWFVDGRLWLAGTDLYFDACCHVNENGNALIAQRMVATLGD